MTPTNTKEMILKEARGLFARKGFEGTSMSEIAERVGIEKPSLYYFFKNKDDLFAAVAEQNWAALADELRTNPALNRTEIITREAFANYLVHIIKNNCEAGLAVLDFNSCVTATPNLFKAAREHRSFMIKKMHEFFKLQKVPNISLAEALVTTAIQGYTVQAQLHEPMVKPEAFGKYLSNVIFNSF